MINLFLRSALVLALLFGLLFAVGMAVVVYVDLPVTFAVIFALGTSSNPIIAQTTPGLKTNRWGYIVIDEATGETNTPGVYAGGDIVTGSATVILAMGAGRNAAAGIMKYLGIGPPAGHDSSKSVSDDLLS